MGSNGSCVVSAKGDSQSTGNISLLVPASSLGKLAHMCEDTDEFRVGTTGDHIVFFRDGLLFSARLMSGRYILEHQEKSRHVREDGCGTIAVRTILTCLAELQGYTDASFCMAMEAELW